MIRPGRMQKGVTLVEALVASIIVVILAIIIFTVFSMFSFQQKESIALMRMQRQYEAVGEQVAFHIRQSAKVLASTDPTYTNSSMYACRPGVASATQINMYNDIGVQFAGYAIDGDAFKEWTGSGWKAFNAAGIVLVDPASTFELSPCRNQVDLHIRVKCIVGDSTVYLPMRKDSYQCRN